MSVTASFGAFLNPMQSRLFAARQSKDSEISDAEAAAILGVDFAFPASSAVGSNVNYYLPFN
ncbi:hypothetical protein [Ralstonia solanacearum]|uniref:Uncharacterized protein n=1 Tax=Ralstonia solanacearum TaxID=305 RepID=A0AAE3NNG9_RALSL|nr:hypothetical protein [Ralstonia solanacearum]MDB0525046.1 hypothetical protein [Ralstonia solanacearum]